MKVLFVSPEGAPFAKTGGLGDVAEALPRALKDRQMEVKVILPYYRSIEKTHGHQMKEVARFVVSLGWRKRECRVHYLAMEEMDYWFVQGEDYFDRDNLYGYGDDGERFAFFSLAVLEFLGHGDYSPDIIHLSDWQTALVPVLLKIRYGQKGGYSHIKTVFTIHNIHYQGICHLSFLKDVLDMEEDGKFLLLHEDQVNLMKGGILACDALTTVSPTYAEEIQTREFGMGLQEVIGKESHKLTGILNGIDEKKYNPATDRWIRTPYDGNHLPGKQACKKQLQKRMGLPQDERVPLIGMVTRLDPHKGITLVMEGLRELMDLGIQLVLLGSGNREMEEFFLDQAKQYQNQFSVQLAFDEVLAREIYSGADFFLMPSLSEPCGLAQMIAARYGTPPIVRKTGGLSDTIMEFHPREKVGNGFLFQGKNTGEMRNAVERALDIYRDKESLLDLQRQAMAWNFSWDTGAAAYYHLYRQLIEEVEIEQSSGLEWMQEGVMYQIFPDRFCRDHGMAIPPMNKDYILREDWGGTPHEGPFEDGTWNKEFFGGNIPGITSRLDDLQDLGVTVIYLNPIFEAYSNHRYDTADYLAIDPMLGTLEDFIHLAEEAKERGIRILLDGVFNHTGSDSRYFNKDGRYPDLGAYQSQDSPYYPWYSFQKYPEEYTGWWGIPTLPAVNETEPSYMEFMAKGDHSVIRTWMRAGAAGFRLDVADELPDEFLDAVAKTIREEREDGCIVGEVWEDASNKVAYGVKRQYFKGKQLDSVMNYPLKDALVEYLTQHHNGEIMAYRVKKLWENYPRSAFRQLMNILGTHDTARILTALSEGSLGEKETRDRHGIALLVWALMPGIPCIYYGDELGYVGGKEPHNRGCYDWDKRDEEIFRRYTSILDFRASIENIGALEYAPYIGEKGVFGFIRRDGSRELLVVVNAGDEVEIDLQRERAPDKKMEFQVEKIGRGTYRLQKYGGLVHYYG